MHFVMAHWAGGGILADAGVSAYGAAIIAAAAAVLGGLLTAGATLGAEALRRRQQGKEQAGRDTRELRRQRDLF
jgi:hypothetical protein